MSVIRHSPSTSASGKSKVNGSFRATVNEPRGSTVPTWVAVTSTEPASLATVA